MSSRVTVSRSVPRYVRILTSSETMTRVSVPTLAMNAASAPGANESFSSAASSGSLARADSMRSRFLPPPANSTTCAKPLKVLAKMLVLSSFVAVTTRNWLPGRGLAASSSANFLSALPTASVVLPLRPPPGRKLTPRHHVSLTGSRNGGVWTDARQAASEASCASSLAALPSMVSTALARRSAGTAASTILRAVASARYSSSPTIRCMFAAAGTAEPYLTSVRK